MRLKSCETDPAMRSPQWRALERSQHEQGSRQRNCSPSMTHRKLMMVNMKDRITRRRCKEGKMFTKARWKKVAKNSEKGELQQMWCVRQASSKRFDSFGRGNSPTLWSVQLTHSKKSGIAGSRDCRILHSPYQTRKTRRSPPGISSRLGKKMDPVLATFTDFRKWITVLQAYWHRIRKA